MKKNTIVITIFYIIYRACLDIIYINWQNPIFGYIGFTLDINVSKLLISYLILMLMLLIIPKNEKKVSYLVLQLHLIIMIIPLTSIYALANFSTTLMLMTTIVFIMQILLLRKLPNIKLIKIKGTKYLVILITIFLTLSTYGYLFLTQQIHLNVLGLQGVYEIRDGQKIQFPISYFIIWQFRIINPIMFVIFYLKRKKKYMVLVGIGQMLIFVMYPHKEVFFSIGFLIILLLIYKRRILFSKFFTVTLILGSLLTVFVYKFLLLLMPYAVLPSRLLFGPARNKFQHYDFFSQTNKLYYSEGFIGKVFGLEYPYHVSTGYVIGSQNGIISNSNTGYIAYAYDNSGFIGMIIMSLLFVLLLKLFDSQTKKYDPKLIFAFIAYPMLILNDGDLLTLMLTGGVFLILLLLFSVDEFIEVNNG